MRISLGALLSNDVPEEMAHHVVAFLSELTLILEEYYFPSTQQCVKNINPSKLSKCPPQILDDEDLF